MPVKLGTTKQRPFTESSSMELWEEHLADCAQCQNQPQRRCRVGATILQGLSYMTMSVKDSKLRMKLKHIDRDYVK